MVCSIGWGIIRPLSPAGGLHPWRVLQATAKTVAARARHDRHTAVDVREHRIEHGVALGLGQPRNLARDAQRREAVHAVGDEHVNDAFQTDRIDGAGGVEGGWKNGEDAVKSHKDTKDTFYLC